MKWFFYRLPLHCANILASCSIILQSITVLSSSLHYELLLLLQFFIQEILISTAPTSVILRRPCNYHVFWDACDWYLLAQKKQWKHQNNLNSVQRRQWHHPGVFVGNFEMISHIILVFWLLLNGRCVVAFVKLTLSYSTYRSAVC